jgi:hypothetical protein
VRPSELVQVRYAGLSERLRGEQLIENCSFATSWV